MMMMKFLYINLIFKKFKTARITLTAKFKFEKPKMEKKGRLKESNTVECSFDMNFHKD